MPSTPTIIAAFASAIALIGALIFWPAGTFAWPAGWLYVALVFTNFVGNMLYLKRVNPELIEARMHVGPGTKHWDMVWGFAFGPLFCAIYVIAGFDAVRFAWSNMPAGWALIGLLIFLPGTVLFSWAMGVNPFFEKTVRIQTERGHRVIDTGPYAFVRHPGYLGFLGWALSAPLLLGSYWAFIPALASVIAIAVRTALEDRTLTAELAGYAEYAQRVRYRLVPGIW